MDDCRVCLVVLSDSEDSGVGERHTNLVSNHRVLVILSLYFELADAESRSYLSESLPVILACRCYMPCPGDALNLTVFS